MSWKFVWRHCAFCCGNWLGSYRLARSRFPESEINIVLYSLSDASGCGSHTASAINSKAMPIFWRYVLRAFSHYHWNAERIIHPFNFGFASWHLLSWLFLWFFVISFSCSDLLSLWLCVSWWFLPFCLVFFTSCFSFCFALSFSWSSDFYFCFNPLTIYISTLSSAADLCIFRLLVNSCFLF